jgi:hypothetical protein
MHVGVYACEVNALKQSYNLPHVADPGDCCPDPDSALKIINCL